KGNRARGSGQPKSRKDVGWVWQIGREGLRGRGRLASSPPGLARRRRKTRASEGAGERRRASVVGFLANSPVRQHFQGAALPAAHRRRTAETAPAGLARRHAFENEATPGQRRSGYSRFATASLTRTASRRSSIRTLIQSISFCAR